MTTKQALALLESDVVGLIPWLEDIGRPRWAKAARHLVRLAKEEREMSTLDRIVATLGFGDRQVGCRVAVIAAFSAVPAWMAVAVLLAMGPGK